MSWATTRNVIDGPDAILYVQDAGVTAAPGTADELGFAISVEWENAPDVVTKGPYINSSLRKKTDSGGSVSGTISVDVADGTDAAREKFFTARANRTKLKLTSHVNPTTGPKEVFDQCIIGISGSVDPAEGSTFEFSFEADTHAHTAATA